MWGFETLEIEPTRDTRQIKKAYARLAVQYHPEEYPEKWQEIHNAFELAMKYAKMGSSPEAPGSVAHFSGSLFKINKIDLKKTAESVKSQHDSNTPQDTDTSHSTETVISPPIHSLEKSPESPQESPPDFASVLTEGQMMIKKQWETDRKKLQKQLQALREVPVKESDAAWKEFLKSDLFLKHRFRTEMIQMLEQTLRGKDISLETYARIRRQIRQLRDEINQTVESSIYETDSQSYLDSLHDLESAARLCSQKGWDQGSDKKGSHSPIAIVIFFLVLLFVLVKTNACQQETTKDNSLPSQPSVFFDTDNPDVYNQLFKKYDPTDLLKEEESQNENDRN